MMVESFYVSFVSSFGVVWGRVNDPTRGYGIFIENMLKEAG